MSEMKGKFGYQVVISVRINSTSGMTSSPSSSVTILDVPEVPMLKIFAYIPLPNLLRIDEVCRAWGKLKTEALLQRQMLIVINKEDDLGLMDVPRFTPTLLQVVTNDDGDSIYKMQERIDRHALYFTAITPKLADKVMQLLPNLKVLHLNTQNGSPTELWKMKLLLHHYRHQLTEVNIEFVATGDNLVNLQRLRADYQFMFPSVFRTLNNMTALTILELTLVLRNGLGVPIEVNLSVASRLAKLTVYTEGFTGSSVDVDVLKPTYEQYAERNEALQALNGMNLIYLDTLLAFGPRVTAALRQARLLDTVDRDNYEKLKAFARKFPLIELMTIDLLSELTIAEVAEALVPCKGLVSLTLNLNFDQKQPMAVPVKNDLPKDKKLPVLPSVKSLCFSINTTSHRNLEQLNLNLIFPNVQGVELVHTMNRCTTCNFQIPERVAEMPAENQAALGRRVHHCMRLTRAYFSRFAKLLVVKANSGVPQLSSSYLIDDYFTPATLDRETFLN